MAAAAAKRSGLYLALIAAILVSGLTLIGQAGADDGDGLPAPTELQVSTERGSLDVALDWDDVPGAASYLVRWRVSGPGNRLNDGISVQSSGAVITVSRFGSGSRGCKPATMPAAARPSQLSSGSESPGPLQTLHPCQPPLLCRCQPLLPRHSPHRLPHRSPRPGSCRSRLRQALSRHRSTRR